MADLLRNESVEEICNSALAAIGETEFIDDISSDKPVPTVLRLLYPQAVAEIETHEYGVWDELMTDIPLTERRAAAGLLDAAKEPSAGMRTEYNMPLHIIAPVHCYEGVTGRALRYEIQDGFLITTKPSGDREVWLRYIRYTENPAEWSTELRGCVIKLLSARVLAAVTKDYSAAQQLESNFWQNDYPRVAASKKNKARRADFKGDEQMLTRGWNIYGDGMSILDRENW